MCGEVRSRTDIATGQISVSVRAWILAVSPSLGAAQRAVLGLAQIGVFDVCRPIPSGQELLRRGMPVGVKRFGLLLDDAQVPDTDVGRIHMDGPGTDPRCLRRRGVAGDVACVVVERWGGHPLRPSGRHTRRESRLELPEPRPDFEPIAGAVAVMTALVDRCNRQRCPTSSPLISPRQICIARWLHTLRFARHLRGARVLPIMLSSIYAASEHQPCGRLSGEFSPQFGCWPTLKRRPRAPAHRRSPQDHLKPDLNPRRFRNSAVSL